MSLEVQMTDRRARILPSLECVWGEVAVSRTISRWLKVERQCIENDLGETYFIYSDEWEDAHAISKHG
jgi:hypothetical protein